ncbi:OLC1v1030963C1 [Oldenlandia corymbosa var. corymbosa]|uniref:OLC1v1030963C1 n=1 Tax=Oldenlandia corymbosa var. corymbosa TaxID=529605 RepID=A0AAV1CKS0_OLDCO|nr:OLC1v1030963C1 [Oldenlandia corymbosa var. corymbosa]
MGNSLSLTSFALYKKQSKSLPIDTIFKFPSPISTWSSSSEEGGFGSGYIDLGGLHVHQITTFNKIWSIRKGGVDNLGATFFEPAEIPDGFFMLGCYAQPNNQPLFGWTLVAKGISNGESSNEILKKPTDYTLIWSSKYLKSSQDGHGYIWLPIAPDGYKSVGYVATNTPEKPSLDKVRCVLEEFTDELEPADWIWGLSKRRGNCKFDVYSSRPRVRGIQAQGVRANTFVVKLGDDNDATPSIACLKNNNFRNFSAMPNVKQIEELLQAYSPVIYFHPAEKYFPSSVNWYFSNGTLLYSKEAESNPVSMEHSGANLPQGGSNDGAHWLDLPIDENSKERVKTGDLQSAEAYLQIKPMLGATFTDISLWIFYPFNGPGTAKLGLIDIPLGKIGEHIADWEHLTLRISNFNGILYKVYFSQHSGGKWIDASLLEFYNGTNKPVAYSALNGHPNYHKPGLVLQGSGQVGIRNDTAKSDKFFDTGSKYSIVSAEYLESEIVEPPWLNYLRHWGPKIAYNSDAEAKKVEAMLSTRLKPLFRRLVKILPNEFYGEDGPTGPKVKGCWNGDEKSCS